MPAHEQIIPGGIPSSIQDPGGETVVFHLSGSTRRYGLLPTGEYTPASYTSDRFLDNPKDPTYIVGDESSNAAIYYSSDELHFRDIHPGGIPLVDRPVGAEPFKLQPNQWTGFLANGLSLSFGNSADKEKNPPHILEFSTDDQGIVRLTLDGNQMIFTLPDQRTTTALPEGEFFVVGRGSKDPNALQPHITIDDGFVSKIHLGFFRLGNTIYAVDASSNGTYLFRK